MSARKLYEHYVCRCQVFNIYCQVCLLITYLLCLANLRNLLTLTFTVAVQMVDLELKMQSAAALRSGIEHCYQLYPFNWLYWLLVPCAQHVVRAPLQEEANHQGYDHLALLLKFIAADFYLRKDS